MSVSHNLGINYPTSIGIDGVKKIYSIKDLLGTAVYWDGFRYGIVDIDVIRLGVDFYAIDLRNAVFQNNLPVPGHVHLYYPIDPRMTKIDIVGANRAWANATNDGWLFAHCDDDHHHDREVSLEDVAISLFQVEINKLQLDSRTKLATLIKRPSDSSAGSRELAARVKEDSMLTVLDDLLECLKKETREKHIGYYHQNPDKSHVHEEIHDCLVSLIGINKLANNATYIEVAGELNRILARLKDKHDYEYRWVKAARIKAEAAKKAAEAENQG